MATFLLLVLFSSAVAQNVTQIKGKVTDAKNGDPIPYAGVSFPGTRISAQTDFEGRYTLRTDNPSDTLQASFMGYKPRRKAVKKGQVQTINFQLEEATVMGQTVELFATENPAYEILRRVVANKERNDPEALSAYETQTYTRLEVDIDNMSEKFRKRKLIKKVQSLTDSIQQMAGEDGKPILPVFVSEASSHVYRLNSPLRIREEIEHSKVVGFMKEENLVTQVIGTTFTNYNFYNNNINLMNKFLASPIADGWKLVYEYDLRDSGEVDGVYCYEIGVAPRRAQDLAFTGTIWIAKDDYALKRFSLRTTNSTNLNFIESVRMQQDLAKTPAGPYYVAKARITLDVAEVAKDWAGMLAKYYASSQLVSVNQPKPLPFYDKQVQLMEGALDPMADSSWNKLRHEPLTQVEVNVFRMIDTVRNMPVIRSYIEIGDIIINGYKRFGGFEFGNYLYTYAYNNVEGHRFRVGGQTNMHFHKRLSMGGYVAYGTLDNQYKYQGRFNYVFDKDKWTILRFAHTKDIEQAALIDNVIQANPLFFLFTRFGDLKTRRPFFVTETQASLTREVVRGLQLTVGTRTRLFDPLYAFTFAGQRDQVVLDPDFHFTASELQFGVRYAPREILLENRLNDRNAFFSSVSPVFQIRYFRGIRGFLNGQYDYHKIIGNFGRTITYGIAGTGRWAFEAGYVPSVVPYPLLRSHLGNPSPFYNPNSYNMMGLFEFISDYYGSVAYQHNFEGLFLNSLPLVKRAKLRLLATGTVLYGGMSRKNVQANTDVTGRTPFFVLGRTPYVEVGYGVENIFRFLRIDVFHRLTYLDKPQARAIGVKASVWFKL